MDDLSQKTDDTDHGYTATDSSGFYTYDVSLTDIMLIIWRKKLVIALFTIVATIAGVSYAWMKSDVFTTKTQFIVKTPNNSNGGNLSQLALLAGISMSTGGNLDPSNYFDKVLTDRNFLSTLFERTWDWQGESLSLDKILHIVPDTTTKDWQYRYFALKIETIRQGKYIQITKDKTNNILTLTVDMPDSKLSYDISVYIIDYLKAYLRNNAKSRAKEQRLFIEARLKETSAELAENEIAIAKYREHNVINKSPSSLLEEGRLIRQVTFSQEIYLQLKKQYELARIEELNEQTLLEVLKNPEIPLYSDRPNRRMIVIISFVLGGIIGVFVALASRVFPVIIHTIKNKS